MRILRQKEISLDQNRSALKWIALAISILIGGGSIYYTNLLVKELRQREERWIKLFANAMEYTSNEQNSNNLIFVYQQIVVQNNSIPLILTDAEGNPKESRNIDFPKNVTPEKKEAIWQDELEIMKQEHEPVVIEVRNKEGEVTDHMYVYYRNSDILYKLKYYPYVQLLVIGVFVLLGYIVFNYSREAEQNKVWVGLAKETAHQLGTPLSSLMAWSEYLKTDERTKGTDIAEELNKDIHKLEMITARFSSIGSVPVLKPENLVEVIQANISYLQKRLSTRVSISLDSYESVMKAQINRPLFEWVIENLCKNAVDAMGGVGSIRIVLSRGKSNEAIVDISDTGKGIPAGKVKHVFQAGYTTKKRGWGLGLTLAKRIIENYHNGKIFVKESSQERGTTFRIVLKQS